MSSGRLRLSLSGVHLQMSDRCTLRYLLCSRRPLRCRVTVCGVPLLVTVCSAVVRLPRLDGRLVQPLSVFGGSSFILGLVSCPLSSFLPLYSAPAPSRCVCPRPWEVGTSDTVPPPTVGLAGERVPVGAAVYWEGQRPVPGVGRLSDGLSPPNTYSPVFLDIL